jgi:hypothetical protein
MSHVGIPKFILIGLRTVALFGGQSMSCRQAAASPTEALKWPSSKHGVEDLPIVAADRRCNAEQFDGVDASATRLVLRDVALIDAQAVRKFVLRDLCAFAGFAKAFG